MLGVATALVLAAFNDNLVFFYSPTDLKTKHVAARPPLRIGGLVENGQREREPTAGRIAFRVTDGKSTVPVTYSGVLPDLFREGQGVVVEGALGARRRLRAPTRCWPSTTRTTCRREVADALKKSGRLAGRPQGEQTEPTMIAELGHFALILALCAGAGCRRALPLVGAARGACSAGWRSAAARRWRSSR